MGKAPEVLLRSAPLHGVPDSVVARFRCHLFIAGDLFGFVRNVFESSLSVDSSLFASDLSCLFLEVFLLSSASLLPLSFHVFLHGRALLSHTPSCPTFPCLSTLILFSLPYIHCFNCLRRATFCYYRMELPYPLDCYGAQTVV